MHYNPSMVGFEATLQVDSVFEMPRKSMAGSSVPLPAGRQPTATVSLPALQLRMLHQPNSPMEVGHNFAHADRPLIPCLAAW